MKLCMHFKHSKDRLLKVLKLFRCPKWKGFGDLSFSRIHNLLNIDQRFQISDTVTDKLFFLKTRYPLGFDSSLAPSVHIEMPYHFSLVVIVQNRLKQCPASSVEQVAFST